MSDSERFDGDDGLTLGYVSELFDPDYRAELAELRAQVRYLADWYAERPRDLWSAEEVAERLRALVGPWPHEGEK